jgi:hypothetical protein
MTHFLNKQTLKRFFSQVCSTIDNLTIPPKRRILGVACGTMFMAVGLEQVFSDQTPFSQSVFLPDFSEKENLPADSIHFEDTVDEDGSPVGRLLTEKERQKILWVLRESSNDITGFVPGPQLPVMILHDTAGQLSREELLNRRQYTRSPLGDGIAVYVPRVGEPIITRPEFFTPYRPTATAYEKGLDFMSEGDRNQVLRTVWNAASPKARQQAVQQVISSLKEHPKDLANRVALWFTAASDRAFDTYLAAHPHQIDGGKTTAIWAIAKLCSQVLSQEDQAEQWSASAQTLTALLNGCHRVNPLLQDSRTRLASSVNVEIVQMEGSDCFVNDADVNAYNAIAADAHKLQHNRAIPLETPFRLAYTDDQYESLAKLYLKIALAAGRFPQIVTHYWLDQGNGQIIGTHCDPRGLKVTEVYDRIGGYLDHPEETIYGLKPQYGLNPEKGDNIWWSDRIMGDAAPPTATAMQSETHF